MSNRIRLRVRGERACFTRPEHKGERVSYDVLTPSAARGILEAVHWKPAIRWGIDRIHVLRPIRFDSIRRNEVGSKLSADLVLQAANGGRRPVQYIEDDRQQRVTLFLRDVEYVIDAHFEMTAKAGPDDTPAKHREMFSRRAEAGQCFHQPCLGVREFPADVALWEGGAPPCPDDLRGPRDLGWMLHDIDFTQGRQPRFFHAVMVDGAIDVPPFPPEGV